MRDRLIGIDMNGWHDFAVRNWVRNNEGKDESFPDGYTVDGSTLSRVVEVGDDDLTMINNRDSWIGGPRAQMAIHGRGSGWGDFGNVKRRILLRRSCDPWVWEKSISELGTNPRIAVLAVPDYPDMDDTVREKRLQAMRSLLARRKMLVWSSVALALTQCNCQTVEAGQKLGIVELDAQGFRVQKLDIIERDGLLTPRRRNYGASLASSIGLAKREEAVLERITSKGKGVRIARALDLADLPALLSMAKPGEVLTELIRLENGDWHEAIGKSASIELDVVLPELLSGCNQVVLHGPCRQGLLQTIASEFRNQSEVPIEIARPEAIAQGAFLVAKRLHRGLPPWFDYLPNIKTIVQDSEDVESLSLVGEDEVAEAGKVWRSSEPMPLMWKAKSQRMEIWLKKEDDPKPRFSPAVVQAPPPRDEKVQLILEQEPAQGRAVLRIKSNTWPELRYHPAQVDWETGKHDQHNRDWDKIIADFKVLPPVIPERVVLPAHRDLWYPDHGIGLAQALKSFDGCDYESVYRALSMRRQVYFNIPDHPEHKRQFYAIDSDGGRPKGVLDEDWDLLENALVKAAEDFTTGKVENNHALGVLSWCFRRCPPTIWPILVRALNNSGGHPVFKGWKIMYPQALGRISSNRQSHISAIDYLNGLDVPWNMNQQACAGFLMSRNDEIFELIERDTIDRWADAAILSLQEALKYKFKKRHQYLPIIIAGLLRWRMREPRAFTEHHDQMALPIMKLLDKAIQRLELKPKDIASYKAVLEAFRDKGTRPDLLQTLFDLL